MSTQPEELNQTQSDQGVPVGAADAEQDRLDAADGGDSSTSSDDETLLEQGAVEEQTDQGVPVGAADAEQDRLNASPDDEDDRG